MIDPNDCPGCIAHGLDGHAHLAECHASREHGRESHACIDDDLGRGYCECECAACERWITEQLECRAEEGERVYFDPRDVQNESDFH